jgi:hypothetical protein
MQSTETKTDKVLLPVSLKEELANVYEGIASSDDYVRNDASLRLIQFCVVTVSALSHGLCKFICAQRAHWLAGDHCAGGADYGFC